MRGDRRLKFFFEMKKTLWKVGLMTEDVGNYNQAMIDFLKTSADFDMLNVEVGVGEAVGGGEESEGVYFE